MPVLRSMQQMSIEAAFTMKDSPRFHQKSYIKKKSPNLFVPGQKHTLLPLPPEILTMILREHFSALEVGIVKPVDLESTRMKGLSSARGQRYLSMALVNITFYRLCVPLLYEHTAFYYTSIYSATDMLRIGYQLNASLRVRIIRANTTLARRIAYDREQQLAAVNWFPKLKHVIVTEKIGGEFDQPNTPLNSVTEPGRKFRKQGVSYEAYVTMVGGSPGIHGYKGKAQRIKFQYVNNDIVRLHQAEYVTSKTFEKWNGWIEGECKQRLINPNPARHAVQSGLICYKNKKVYWVD